MAQQDGRLAAWLELEPELPLIPEDAVPLEPVVPVAEPVVPLVLELESEPLPDIALFMRI